MRGHRVVATDVLRAGVVKARRPRASAVEAERRALHDAEHSASLERVMAGVIRACTRRHRANFR